MYIPNFSFLAQFGDELCKEQTQKRRENDQKPTSFWLLWGEMGLKSREPQKAPLGHLLNMHT